MTNNFNKVKEFINNYCIPLEKEEFFFLQIIKRRKDNPDMKKGEYLLDNFYLYSIADFDKLEERIIEICEVNNARACLRLNRRNDNKIATRTLITIAQGIDNGNYRTARNAYPSCCGKYSGERKAKWLIDIDDTSQLEEVRNYLSTIATVYDTFPSKSGYHIITSGFNPNLFKKEYPDIDFHKDNMIVLYCP